MRTTAILLLLLAVDVAAGDDLERFQGGWQQIAVERDGKKASDDDARRVTLDILGQHFTLRRDGVLVSRGTFRLDPDKHPKQADETLSIGPNKGKVFQAIYEIANGEHRICFAAPSQPRPTEFTAPAGSGRMLQLWKLTRPAKKSFTNALGMTFVELPAGSFRMGSTGAEKGRGDEEHVRAITFTKPLFVGIHLVTQDEWCKVMKAQPSEFRGEDDLPVDSVSWDDAQEFCRKLSARDGKRYRLLTEAEWEYACRAGTTTPFYTGATLADHQANYDARFVYGPGKVGKNRGKTTRVGTFPPNAWGLYDMHGNLWQWCQDRHGGYQAKDLVDPQGPRSGANRVLRGGSWGSNPIFCRSANRNFATHDSRTEYYGLRICFTPE